MSGEVLFRGFSALMFSAVMAAVVFMRDKNERFPEDGARRYVSYISGALLPGVVAALGPAALLKFGTRAAAQMMLDFCFGVFLHICGYYLLLMPALPVLRRHFSARSCAMLWMIPNYLYVTQMDCMVLSQPRWVIEAPSALVWGLLYVWLAGFVAVLSWKIGSHLVFRARILRHAVPVSEQTALCVWRQEVEAARLGRAKLQLVYSPDVRTPLSVGLFRRSVRVVLPKRRYAPEELALIFRHELIHIGREDAWSKFFLVFCTAMCWWNPFMWAAAKRSAEDLELSCDETVLLDAGGEEKRRYAELLLKTAGDERGFTTCLSACARTLRYRLKNVMQPAEKRSGALVVGLAFFLLCMSCGYTALAYGEETGAERIYRSQGPEGHALSSVRWEGGPYDVLLVCTDEDGLHRYLSCLRMEHVAGNYSFDQEGRCLQMIFDTPDGVQVITLSGRYIELAWLYEKETYYLPDGTDWGALRECIAECPALSVRVTGEDDGYGEEFSASLWEASLVGESGARVLYEMPGGATPSGLLGYPAAAMTLCFSAAPEGEYEVEVVPLNGGKSRMAVLEGQAQTLQIREAPARYIVRGRFRDGNGALYRAEFRFEIGDL